MQNPSLLKFIKKRKYISEIDRGRREIARMNKDKVFAVIRIGEWIFNMSGNAHECMHISIIIKIYQTNIIKT